MPCASCGDAGWQNLAFRIALAQSNRDWKSSQPLPGDRAYLESGSSSRPHSSTLRRQGGSIPLCAQQMSATGVRRPSGPADRDDYTLPIMTWEDTYQALKRLPIGTPIPKVDSTREYKIKQWSYRDGEERLSYTVANKSIPVSWIRGCFEELRSKGELRTAWFRERFYQDRDLGGCNFTTIGGLFVVK